jgi:hypothetical protein
VRRGRRKRGLNAANGPGMVRLTMVDIEGDHAGDHHRQQRSQRGRRRDASSRSFRPGDVRVTQWKDDSVNEMQAQHLWKLAQEWRDQAQWIRDQPNGQEADRKTAAAVLDSCARQLDEGLDRPA